MLWCMGLISIFHSPQGSDRRTGTQSFFVKEGSIAVPAFAAKDPGITLSRYDRNADGLTSEKWSMYDRNADENGQKFRQVRYCVGTNVTVGWEVRSTMGTNVVNLGRQIFI